MSDLRPIPAPPPVPTEPPLPRSIWWRLSHPRAAYRAARRARTIAAHHAWTTERARDAQTELVRAGFHLGPIPFGYQPDRITVVHADGETHRRTRLVLDPAAGAVVATIYRWRVQDRLNPRSIAHRLTALDDVFPTPTDPATGATRPWTSTAVSRVLTNPVYTGATVWGRTHAGQPVPPEHWIVCAHAHTPIIDGRTFYQAQLLAPPTARILNPHLPPWEFSAPAPGGESESESESESDRGSST